MANGERDSGLREAAHLFGLLAEPARLRILQLLREGAMCGRELARDLNLTPATTCHHLEKLKLANLLSERRSGRHVYYSISDSELARAVERSLATLADGNPLPQTKATAKRRISGEIKKTKQQAAKRTTVKAE